MNTAVLAGGLPPGFDPGDLGARLLSRILRRIIGQRQNTEPGPPVIPPVGGNDRSGQPAAAGSADQSRTRSTRWRRSSDPVPNAHAVRAAATQQQAQQQQQQQQPGGSDPTRPAASRGRSRSGSTSARTATSICRRPNETRLVGNEVVLQMPCNVPQAVLDDDPQAAQSDGARLAVPAGGRQRRLPDALRQQPDRSPP